MSDSGAGESRTPVQTCRCKAFYMFIFHLDFRPIAGWKQPAFSLASIEFHKYIKALYLLGLLLRSH